MYSQSNTAVNSSARLTIDFKVRFMSRLPIPVFVVFLFNAVVFTGMRQSAVAAETKVSRVDRFKAITGDFEKKYTAYMQAFDSAKTDADRALAEKKKPSDGEFGKQLLALVKEAPGDAVAFDALTWIFENVDSADSAPQQEEAVAQFEKQHLKSARLKTALPSLAACVKAESLLAKLGESGPSRDIRGLALFHLAVAQAQRNNGTDEKRQAAIEALLERVQKEYGNIQPDDEDKTLAKLAEGLLFEIRYLRPGKVIPDLVGTDVAGKPLKLSGFRGKVVLLVFWGTWCGPCMAKVPFERQLMEKHAGRPFTVIGVNSGDPKNKAASVMKEQKMNWPSFFDGEDGPIISRWNISNFPTVFLIDAKGVIRMKDQPDDYVLNKAVAEAVDQAEGK
jgi:thiol-disulfide isomerase/thioredoxin